MRSAMPRDHVHVVLDHQDGAPGRDFLDQLRDAVARPRGPCPAVGSSSSISSGSMRQRRGDFQRALAAVGQVDRRPFGETRQGRPARAAPSRGRSGATERLLALPEVEGVPSLRCSATRTFSSTVRCGNTAEIWNERMMPRRAICAGFSRVMSRPLKRIWPAVGGRNLVSRLKQVVLPAPFGPISAWMWPRSDLQVHVVDGGEALELLGQVVVSRMKSAMRRIRRLLPAACQYQQLSDDALTKCQHAGHEDRAGDHGDRLAQRAEPLDAGDRAPGSCRCRPACFPAR